MDDFNCEMHFEITFDIMAKIADDFEAQKPEIMAQDKETWEKQVILQNLFRKLMGKYQNELHDKYGVSFSEFNQQMTLYREIIDYYLEDKPEMRKKYDDLKLRLRIM